MVLPGGMLELRGLRGMGIALIVLCSMVAPARQGIGAQATEPTFNRDVAPIVYANCTMCHRPGGIGPFSLLTYAGAQRQSTRIAKAVSTGHMPPWHADAPKGTFSNDRRLSEADRATLLRWIEVGSPEGDAKDLRPAPVYTSDWTIPTPDVVLQMPDEYEVPEHGTIEYQYFEVPTNFTEDKWIQALEIMPGAREVVHHVLVFARAPKAAPSANAPKTPAPKPLLVFRDDRGISDPPPGPDGKPQEQRDVGALIGTTAPGTNVQWFPAGTALRVRAGSVLTFQMHYTAKGHAMKDRTKVGFVFAKAPPEQEIRATQFLNGQFNIPAGAFDYPVAAEVGFTDSAQVWGIFPHTHLRGKKWEYRLIYPDGRTETLLSVPNYDFNWQTYYLFAKPVIVPPGARIESYAWYDNSASNKNNPDATKDVKWGDQTWEEMQYTGLLVSRIQRKPEAPKATQR